MAQTERTFTVVMEGHRWCLHVHSTRQYGGDREGSAVLRDVDDFWTFLVAMDEARGRAWRGDLKSMTLLVRSEDGTWSHEGYHAETDVEYEPVPYTGDTSEIDRRVAGYLSWVE